VHGRLARNRPVGLIVRVTCYSCSLWIRRLATTAANEFSPVCAVVGGMLGQDILKTLAGKEPPIANFFVFDGVSCNGIVVRMSMEAVYEGPPPGINIDL